MKACTIFLLLISILMLFIKIDGISSEIKVYDFENDYNLELTQVIIKNDTLISKNYQDNYIYSFDFNRAFNLNIYF